MLAEDLSSQEINEINLKLGTLKKALKENCPKDLKNANEALDKATEPLAVLIIEKALTG